MAPGNSRPITAAECCAVHQGLQDFLQEMRKSLEEKISDNKETVIAQQKDIKEELEKLNGGVQANTAFRLEARGMVRAALFLATVWGAVAAGLVIFLR